MSDLLGRLAARAVGAAPLAVPRPTTPFERGPQGELRELVEEVPASPRAEQPGTGGGAPRASVTVGDPSAAERSLGEAEAASPPRGEELADGEAASDPAARGGRPESRGVPSAPAPRGRPPARRDVVIASAARDEGQLPASREAVPAAAVGVPAAVAAAPAGTRIPSVHRPAAAGEPAQAAPETPAVRVHIGRLEVRANLQQPSRPEPARRPEARVPALSLSDYLRGSGGAR